MQSLTKTLLGIIGSPLLDKQPDVAVVESRELFDYAFKNNVEMLYVNRLEESGKVSELSEDCQEIRARQKQTLKTIHRLSSVLQAGDIPHAITKTIRPYPGTPNDVDTLYLGDLSEYEATSDYLLKNNYKLTGPMDMQYEFFDVESGEAFDKFKTGGRFYIDFYRELAADHMPYMDSDVLAGEVVDHYIEGFDKPIKVLSTRAELVVLALHSIVMHRTIPLEVVYTYSYLLASMGHVEIDDLWAFARKNHAEPSVRAVLAIIEKLYEECFGIVPEQIAYFVKIAGTSSKEARELCDTGLFMPHTALLWTFVASVFSKIRGKRARRGFFKELLHMLNPVFAVEVLYHMLSKRRIRRHSAHV